MEDYLMEEDLELLERGLLSEVDNEVDSDDLWPEDHDSHVDPYNRGATTKPVKIVNSKVLNYLGNVKESKTYNSRAWLLQSMLNVVGYPLTADGFFGQLTDQAVRKFQTDNGMKVDGIVGPASWTRLIYHGRNKISNSTIQEKDFENAAISLGVEVEVVKAIKDVESSGSGYLFSNHPKILFEGHVFWKLLDKCGGKPSQYSDSDILYPKWSYDHYKGDVAEHVRLQKARRINRDAANASASWGLFQIMGNNYKACGCKSVDEFVDRMRMSESEQLNLFVAFIKYHNMHLSLRPGNIKWAEFARRYNGAGYEKNKYHIKLENAYLRYKNKKK